MFLVKIMMIIKIKIMIINIFIKEYFNFIYLFMNIFNLFNMQILYLLLSIINYSLFELSKILFFPFNKSFTFLID